MTEDLRERVLRRLEAVIDPETGVDVVRMRLIEDLAVDADGLVSYKFRPSSPFCPLAVPPTSECPIASNRIPTLSNQSQTIF
jgi:metal-sulfur cluster biosynthetic enzyme